VADTFSAALQEHLSAIQARDAERFVRTLGRDVIVVDGKGVITRGTAEVQASHAAWFAMDADWRFQYQIVATRESSFFALALLHVTYRHTASEQPSRFLLSLVFERDKDGEFRFVYDQNTPLP